MTVENFNNETLETTPEAPAPSAPVAPGINVSVGTPAPQLIQFVKGPTNPIGTGAGVLGIVGMALIMVPFIGGILTLLAAILGGVGLSKSNKEGLPKGMAVTGLVLGIIGVVIYAIVTVFLAAASTIEPSAVGALGL